MFGNRVAHPRCMQDVSDDFPVVNPLDEIGQGD